MINTKNDLKEGEIAIFLLQRALFEFTHLLFK